jgi:alkylhydroperoxidase/carboxymuconolactone decarboxylase family protein YurZ
MDSTDELKQVKGFLPRSVKYAKSMDEDFGDAVAGFYKAVWDHRQGGLSLKEKHLLVFTVACANNNTESAVKILERLKKFNATRAEIFDAMMIAAWTGGIQNFTDFSNVVLKEMEKLDI